jgi:hypothetical protein
MKLRLLSENPAEHSRNILSSLETVQWRVYKTSDWDGHLTEYVPVLDFIKRLEGITTYKEFKTLPYSLEVIRNNFGFLMRDKATKSGEVQHYVDRTIKSFILGANVDINALSSTQDFHTDDEFGHHDVFVWFDDNYVYEGRPYHMPNRLGPTPPEQKNLLETFHKILADFLTKDLK